MALGLIGLAVGSLLSAHEKEEEEKQSKRHKPRQTQGQGQRKTRIQTEKNRKKKKLATCLIGMVKGTSACELKVLQFVKKKKAKKECKTNKNTRK